MERVRILQMHKWNARRRNVFNEDNLKQVNKKKRIVGERQDSRDTF